jgi:hypothetical protein
VILATLAAIVGLVVYCRGISADMDEAERGRDPWGSCATLGGRRRAAAAQEWRLQHPASMVLTAEVSIVRVIRTVEGLS